MRASPSRQAPRAGALSGCHRALRVHTSFDRVRVAPPQDKPGRRYALQVGAVLVSARTSLEEQTIEPRCK
jgi:hypothetical protein